MSAFSICLTESTQLANFNFISSISDLIIAIHCWNIWYWTAHASQSAIFRCRIQPPIANHLITNKAHISTYKPLVPLHPVSATILLRTRTHILSLYLFFHYFAYLMGVPHRWFAQNDSFRNLYSVCLYLRLGTDLRFISKGRSLIRFREAITQAEIRLR
jgi:hypothetical protein